MQTTYANCLATNRLGISRFEIGLDRETLANRRVESTTLKGKKHDGLDKQRPDSVGLLKGARPSTTTEQTSKETRWRRRKTKIFPATASSQANTPPASALHSAVYCASPSPSSPLQIGLLNQRLLLHLAHGEQSSPVFMRTAGITPGGQLDGLMGRTLKESCGQTVLYKQVARSTLKHTYTEGVDGAPRRRRNHHHHQSDNGSSRALEDSVLSIHPSRRLVVERWPRISFN